MTGGAAVFIATDFTSEKRLIFCKQDPIYLKLDVAVDPHVHWAYRLGWWSGDKAQGDHKYCNLSDMFRIKGDGIETYLSSARLVIGHQCKSNGVREPC